MTTAPARRAHLAIKSRLGLPRALLYAVANDSDTNNAYDFVPIRGLVDGQSNRDSFFDEHRIFGRYRLEHDQVNDGGATVRTLKLLPHPEHEYPPTNILLLGLDKTQFDTLQALDTAGISRQYVRNLRLDNKTSHQDDNGKRYDKYQLGIQGLTADGTFQTEQPTSPIEVYSVDGHFFFTQSFAAAEPLPPEYFRDCEEEPRTTSV